jgi:hypothetical protein
MGIAHTAPDTHPRTAPAAPRNAQKGESAADKRGKNNTINSFVLGRRRKKLLMRSEIPEKIYARMVMIFSKLSK